MMVFVLVLLLLPLNSSSGGDDEDDNFFDIEHSSSFIVPGIIVTTTAAAAGVKNKNNEYYYYHGDDTNTNANNTTSDDAPETTTTTSVVLGIEEENNNTTTPVVVVEEDYFELTSSIIWLDNNNNSKEDDQTTTKQQPLMLVDSVEVISSSCNAGWYLPVGSAVCIQCETGTYTVAQPTTPLSSCTLCLAGTFGAGSGATQCVQCPAGSFSYFAGSSVCTVCPTWTGSAPGMSECVTCSNNTACLYSGTPTRSCPRCESACTLCRPGYYNDGSPNNPGCVACGPGTYNPVSGAASETQCRQCAAGTYTKAFSSGMTVCLSCAIGLAKPANTHYVDSTSAGFDSLLCVWECDTGYQSMPSGIAIGGTAWNNYYSSFTSLSQQYTDVQAVALIRLRNDYCCRVADVGTGQYLDGCDKSRIGNVFSCNPILNGHYIPHVPEVNLCAYWACDDGYYKLNEQCIEQPVCEDGYTYKRTDNGMKFAEFMMTDDSSSGLEIIIEPPGRYVCVPCPVCVDGTETLVGCSRTDSAECRMCGGGATYSANGGPCVADVPDGHRGVTILLGLIPEWGARPMYQSDGVVPFVWDKATVFSSYIKCADAGIGFSYTGNDELCRLAPGNMCDQCDTQCAQWKRTGGWFQGEGWYAGSDGQCQSCMALYDVNKCAYDEYLDMSGCGPINQPSCVKCSGQIVAGQEYWANPRDSEHSGVSPCRVMCKKGFMELNNNECIDCTSIPGFPEIAVPLNGCDEWTCPRGFLKNDNVCDACPSSPLSGACGIGLYPGFNAENNVCLSCMLCVKPINATFISNGTREGGYSSCSYKCNDNYWYTSNRECIQCTNKRSCLSGVDYFMPCTASYDSKCVKCSVCVDGYNTSRQCTVDHDAACTPCDVNLLPGANTAWDGTGCKLWKCKSNFWLNAGLCVECKTVCAPNEKLEVVSSCSSAIAANSGKCVQCAPLAAGLCFIGDGRCGSSPCGGTVNNNNKLTTTTSTLKIIAKTTTTTTTRSSSPPLKTAAIITTTRRISATTPASLLTQQPLTSTTTTAAEAPAAFATVAVLTMKSTEIITATVLSDLVRTVSTFLCTPSSEVVVKSGGGNICEVSVLSVTENNITTICNKGVCPGYTSRRVLLEVETSSSDVTVGIVTRDAVTPDITSLFDNMAVVSAYKVMPNAQVTNLTVILDSGKLISLVAAAYTDYSRRNIVVVASGSDNTILIIGVAVGAVIVVVIAVGVKWVQNNNNKGVESGAVSHTPPPVTSGSLQLGETFGKMVKSQ